ncbi:hypothetical protein EDB89DRAFT_2078066 [Lactarius sanguifluus]|nr:hypothetical protein EDB89DRAFT_2078066 [Lactarius sanguifluus]
MPKNYANYDHTKYLADLQHQQDCCDVFGGNSPLSSPSSPPPPAPTTSHQLCLPIQLGLNFVSDIFLRYSNSVGDMDKAQAMSELMAIMNTPASPPRGPLSPPLAGPQPPGFPLVKYAAKHWVDHAQFEKVSSRVQDGIDDLFDSSKPHFAAWIQVHSVDQAWYFFSTGWFWQGFLGVRSESPLYYAAFCGFYDLVEGLVMKHPEQVNQHGGRLISPLQVALFQQHFSVTNLLHNHGAVVDL